MPAVARCAWYPMALWIREIRDAALGWIQVVCSRRPDLGYRVFKSRSDLGNRDLRYQRVTISQPGEVSLLAWGQLTCSQRGGVS